MFYVYCFLGLDTSSRCSREGPQRDNRTANKCRSLTVCWELRGNWNLSKTKIIKWWTLQVTRHFTPETENVDFYDVAEKMIWWQPLTVWTDWIVTRNREKYLMSCMASRFNCLIKLNQHISNLSIIVTKNDYFFCPNNLIVHR